MGRNVEPRTVRATRPYRRNINKMYQLFKRNQVRMLNLPSHT